MQHVHEDKSHSHSGTDAGAAQLIRRLRQIHIARFQDAYGEFETTPLARAALRTTLLTERERSQFVDMMLRIVAGDANRDSAAVVFD